MEEDNKHITCLEKEFEWLEQVIQYAVSSYLMHEGYENTWLTVEAPNLSDDEGGAYASFVHDNELNIYERLAMVLAMAPHVYPEKLDVFLEKTNCMIGHLQSLEVILIMLLMGFCLQYKRCYLLLVG